MTSVNILLCFESSLEKAKRILLSEIKDLPYHVVNASIPGWAEKIGDSDHVYVLDTRLVDLLIEDGIPKENIHVLSESSQGILIPKSDQYTLRDVKVFKYKKSEKGFEVIHADIPRDFKELLKPQLQELARNFGVKNYSKLNKTELIDILNKTIHFESRQGFRSSIENDLSLLPEEMINIILTKGFTPKELEDLPTDMLIKAATQEIGSQVRTKEEALYILTEPSYDLIVASSEGYLSVVKYILNNYKDIKLDDSFIEASEHGHFEVVRLLLENGANVHAKDDRALLWASIGGHIEVVRLLLENGASIHAVDDQALRWTSYYGHHLEVVRLLLENGADIHAADDYALRNASYKGHLEVVRLLLENGADVHALDDEALRWASRRGHREVVSLLQGQ